MSPQSYRAGFLFGIVSFGAVALLGMVSTIATARVFGVVVIGQFALAYAPTGVVWFLSSIREQAALVRELATLPPRAPRVTALFVAVFSLSTAMTAVASLIAIIATWF